MTENQFDAPVAFCDNCGARKELKYCPVCGQNSRNYNTSLIKIVRSVVGEVFEIDSRLSQTVKAMFLRPGQLTVEFTKNRRASYSSPIRIYLVTSILYFFVISLIASPFGDPTRRAERIDVGFGQETQEFATNEEEVQDVLRDLEIVLDGDSKRRLREVLNRPDGSTTKIAISSLIRRYKEAEISNFDKFVIQSSINLAHAPDRALERLMDNLPLCMLVLLPWLAVVLKLMYIRTGTPFAHHTVFAMHTVSYGFVVLTIWGLLELLIGKLSVELIKYVDLAFRVYLFAYWLVALRTTYGQSWWLTAIKLIGVLLLFGLMLGPAIGLVAIITFMQL